MTTDRIVRVNELLRREIGEALFCLMNEAGFDMAAITVTEVHASRNLQRASVRVSIRAPVLEQEKMLAQMRHHRLEIQSRINHNLHLRYTPRLMFEIDPSLEKGDRMLSLLSGMEQESGDVGEDAEPSGERQPPAPPGD